MDDDYPKDITSLATYTQRCPHTSYILLKSSTELDSYYCAVARVHTSSGNMRMPQHGESAMCCDARTRKNPSAQNFAAEAIVYSYQVRSIFCAA